MPGHVNNCVQNSSTVLSCRALADGKPQCRHTEKPFFFGLKFVFLISFIMCLTNYFVGSVNVLCHDHHMLVWVG